MEKPQNESGPVPMRLKTMEPNKVTAGQILASLEEIRELSRLKPNAAIALHVYLGFDDLQAIINAITKAFNSAAGEEKGVVMETAVELPFQPFPIEQFSGGDLSASAFLKLKGWLLTRTPSQVKLPEFGTAGEGSAVAKVH